MQHLFILEKGECLEEMAVKYGNWECGHRNRVEATRLAKAFNIKQSSVIPLTYEQFTEFRLRYEILIQRKVA